MDVIERLGRYKKTLSPGLNLNGASLSDLGW
jgi:regulator of protease activity HflC (stomatin/prohibitin superfamily)